MKKPILIGVVVFISIMGVMLFLALSRLSERRKENTARSAHELNSIKNRISASLQNSLSATRTLARLLRTNLTPDDFEKITNEVVGLNPFIDAIEVTKEGMVTQVYPTRGNHTTIHYDILTDSILYIKDFNFIKKKKKLIFAGPLLLKNGDVAIIGRIPIYDQLQFKGLSIVIIRMSTFLKTAGIDTVNQNSFCYQLSKMNLISGEEDLFLSTPLPKDSREIFSAIIPEGEWKVYVWNKTDSSFPYSIIVLSLFGLCFSIMAGLYAHQLANKSAEKKILLEDNERKLSLIFDSAVDILFLISVKGDEYFFSKVNNAFLSTVGLSEVQVIGHLVSQIISEPLLSIALQNVKKSILFKQAVRWEESTQYNNIKRTGIVAIIPHFNKKGECDMLVGSVHDITDLKKVEDQNSLFTSIVNTSNDAIISKTLQGIITSWNYGAEKVFGYKANEIIGRHITTLIPPPLHQEENTIIGRIKNGEVIQHYETERIKKSGEVFYVSLTISPLKDSNGKIIGASKILRDISDRKKTELQLLKYAQELELSNQELEQFAFIASHDLQEPLRMVGSYMQLLERRYKGKLDEDADQFIGFAVDGAARMKQLINDLLNYSRLHRQNNAEVVDLNQVLQTVRKNLEANMKEKNAILNASDLPTLTAHRTQMVQLFQNLINNAIKFKREGVDPVVDINFSLEQGQWLFSIHDNGIGIEPQYADKVFVIFKQLHSKSKYGGTGIGLAIAKKIVERHGGRIWFESEVGKGTTFFFTLNKQVNETDRNTISGGQLG